MTRRRRRLLIGSAVLTLAGVLVTCYLRLTMLDPVARGRRPVSNEFVGQRREDIIKRFDLPTSEWQGHYGLPGADYAEQHSPATTMVYERFTGRLFLSFEQKGDEWICFSSDWLPSGMEF